MAMTSQLERPDSGPGRSLDPAPRTLGQRASLGPRPRERLVTRSHPTSRLATPTLRVLWVILSGALFIAAGIHIEAPPLILLGALALAIIPAAWFMALTAAASLAGISAGRTHITLSSHEETLPLDSATLSGVGGRPSRATNLALGRPHLITARITPPPHTRGLSFSLTPKGSEALRIEPVSPPEPAETGTARPPGSHNEASGHRAVHADDSQELSFALTGLRLGDVFLHGFIVRAEVALGLFRVSSWLAQPLVFRVLPERLLPRPPRLSATRAVESQSELIQRDKRGFGMEIRELRDFAPGDPFKHIAWRASARRGKLIAREFESERSLSVWLCLDVSPSMWWGPVGRARIDHALAMACELARTLTAGRDKVGLVIHDHTSRVIIEPGRGSTQYTRMLEALLEVPHLTLEDMTEVTDRELVDRVLRWFEVQERRTFPRLTERPHRRAERPAPRQSPVDVASLAAACRQALGERRRLLPIDAYAVDPELATLRVFCREVGIALPPDPTPRPGGQAQGIEAALSAVLTPVAGKKAAAHTILSLSDLVTADDQDALKRVALTARRHRHSLVFVQPVGERAELPPITARRGQPNAPSLARALMDIQTLRAEETRRRVQTLLKPSGASFITVHPGESLTRVLSELEALS